MYNKYINFQTFQHSRATTFHQQQTDDYKIKSFSTQVELSNQTMIPPFRSASVKPILNMFESISGKITKKDRLILSIYIKNKVFCKRLGFYLPQTY